MTDWEDLLAKRAEVLGTPHIFGKKMQIMWSVHPYETRWELDFCGVDLTIQHSRKLADKKKEAWTAYLRISGRLADVATREEAEAFLEAELRELRDALQKNIP